MAIEGYANSASASDVTIPNTTIVGSLTSGATSTTFAASTYLPAAGQFRIIIDSERILVTALVANVGTLVRGQEGSSAASHLAGASVFVDLTVAAFLNNPLAMTTFGDLPSLDTNLAQTRIAAVATGNALISGGVGALPVWDKVTTAHFASAAVSQWTNDASYTTLALVNAQNLSVFAATTSAQLAGVLSDETGFSAGAKAVFSISPTLTTPVLGVATATSLNGNTFTTGTYTLTGTAAKTLTFTNSLTLSGTDATTMTFPTTSATIARTDASNTFVGTQTLTGVVGASSLVVTGAAQTASFPVIDVAQTWNNAAVTFTLLKGNITNTASASGSFFVDFQVAGTSAFSVSRTADLRLAGAATILVSGTNAYIWNQSDISQVIFGASADVRVCRDAAGILGLRNATSAQNFRIYNTFTTVTTVGEWAKFDWITTANQFRIGAVKGSSTGTARVLSIDYGGTEASPSAAITVPITSGNIVFGGGITLPGGATFLTTNTALTDGAGASIGTLTNAPAATNPTKWIGINDNGTTRYIPAW